MSDPAEMDPSQGRYAAFVDSFTSNARVSFRTSSIIVLPSLFYLSQHVCIFFFRNHYFLCSTPFSICMLGLRFTVLFVSHMDFRGQRVRFRSSYDNSISVELFHRPNRKWRFVRRLAGICLKAHSRLYRRRSTLAFSKKTAAHMSQIHNDICIHVQ